MKGSGFRNGRTNLLVVANERDLFSTRIDAEGLRTAVDLHNGPLPEALAKLFPDGLEEVPVGAISGFRKGKAVKKKAAKKRKK